MIGTGAMTDPYIPLELEICNVRKALELIYEYGFGAAIHTKSKLLLRDAGIPTVVWLSPILPFINDTEENISGLLDMCAEAKVKGILCPGMGVTLREGNREYFYKQLDRHFPGMKEKYIRTYGNQYMLDSPNQESLMRLLERRCEENGIMYGWDRVFQYMYAFEEKGCGEQLSLWDWKGYA